MNDILTLDKMFKISNNIVDIIGKNFNYNNLTITLNVSKEVLKKINEEFFYKTKKENDVLTEADMVIAKINGVNFEFKEMDNEND